MDTIDVALTELGRLNEKTDKLLSHTRKLIQDLDSEARAVKDHLKRVKQMLGIPETACCICFKQEPTHCLDSCHHVFCYACATKCLRSSSKKCFICRQVVNSIFKIYSS